MKPTNRIPGQRGVAITLLALALLALSAPACVAADAAVMPAVLPAFDLMDIVHDRTRLIQFSIGAVALGIGLLWWGQKT